MKMCSKCKKTLKLEEFSRDRTSKDGRHTICLVCKRKYDAIRREHKKDTIKKSRVKYNKKIKLKNKYKKEDIKKFKNCISCKTTKNISEFHKDCTRPDNRAPLCKPCKSLKFKKYAKENPEVIRSKGAKRRACKNKATPNWLSTLQKNQIKKVYRRAVYLEETTNLKFNVDHIIPLNHPDICGLHVPWNLQVLEKTKNIKKSNKILI